MGIDPTLVVHQSLYYFLLLVEARKQLKHCYLLQTGNILLVLKLSAVCTHL